MSSSFHYQNLNTGRKADRLAGVVPGNYVLALMPRDIPLIDRTALSGSNKPKPALVLGLYPEDGCVILGFQTTRADCAHSPERFMVMKGHVHGLNPPRHGRGGPFLNRGLAIAIPATSPLLVDGTNPIGFADNIEEVLRGMNWGRDIPILPRNLRPGDVYDPKKAGNKHSLRRRYYIEEFVPA